MNLTQSRKVLETITSTQIKAMFDNAKASIKDWTRASNNNKGLTKGVAWNILAADFDENKECHKLAKLNMIREFGEYLPSELKPNRKLKAKSKPVHQEPIFKTQK